MAQERCVRKSYSRNRLWIPGEVRTANTDDQGRPVASMHFRLVGADEEVEPSKVFTDAKVKAARAEAGLRDKRAAITNALNGLDPDDDSHWTQAGWPSVQAVFSRVDFEVTRNEIMAAAPDFNRDAAKGRRS